MQLNFTHFNSNNERFVESLLIISIPSLDFQHHRTTQPQLRCAIRLAESLEPSWSQWGFSSLYYKFSPAIAWFFGSRRAAVTAHHAPISSPDRGIFKKAGKTVVIELRIRTVAPLFFTNIDTIAGADNPTIGAIITVRIRLVTPEDSRVVLRGTQPGGISPTLVLSR